MTGSGPTDISSGAKRLVPASVKRSVRPVYDRARSEVRRRAAERDLRRRYGHGLVLTVDDRDEMFRFMEESWKWPYHVERMRAPSDAMRTYLLSGDGMVRDLERALGDQGRRLADVGSFLEFACGYGRFTRFLVARVDPARVTVSDIDTDAVAFQQATFAVDGFASTESAADLEHDGQYEVVFVASLFSHLAFEHWRPWLQRLYGFVAPGGLLVLSAHGTYARDVIYGERWRSRLTTPADGFSYLETNETGGRLALDYYGSAFVTEDFVAHEVAELPLGSIVQMYPALLWGSQDLYVIERHPTG